MTRNREISNLTFSVVPKFMLILRAMFERSIASDPEIADFRVGSLKRLGDFSIYYRHTSLRQVSVRLTCSCKLKPRFAQTERGVSI